MERSGAEKVIYGEANRGISILSIRSRCRPEKACRVKVLASIFLVAVLLNYLWELAQAPLYVGLQSYDRSVLGHCFVASLGDGIIVLAITATGRVILGRWDWFKQPGASGYLVMLATGLALAVLVESVALQLMGRWQYAVKMPRVLGIGVVPIAQMFLLPPLVFRIVVGSGAKRLPKIFMFKKGCSHRIARSMRLIIAVVIIDKPLRNVYRFEVKTGNRTC